MSVVWVFADPKHSAGPHVYNSDAEDDSVDTRCPILKYSNFVYISLIGWLKINSCTVFHFCVWPMMLTTTLYRVICIQNNKMHKILAIRLYFLLDALHVSDYISPSTGATFISCTSYLVYANTFVCCVAIATQQTYGIGIYQIRCTAYKRCSWWWTNIVRNM